MLSKLPAEWVVVEFSSERSAACLAMKPAFESLAKERPQLAFARVDVGRMPKTALAHAATRVPSYLFLWDSVSELDFAGASERRLRDALRDCLELGPTECERCQYCDKLMHGVKLRAHQDPVHGDCPMRERLCPYDGCARTFVGEELEEHVATCEHRVVQCPFKGCFVCKKTLDMKAHAQCCDHRLIECTSLCGARMKAAELQSHLQSCPGRPRSPSPGGTGAARPRPPALEPLDLSGGGGAAQQGGPPGQPREHPPDGTSASRQQESQDLEF